MEQTDTLRQTDTHTNKEKTTDIGKSRTGGQTTYAEIGKQTDRQTEK